MEFIAHRLLQLRELIDRYAIHNVDFTSLIAVNVSGLGTDGQIGDLINNRVPIVPIMWVTLGNNALIDHPLR